MQLNSSSRKWDCGTKEVRKDRKLGNERECFFPPFYLILLPVRKWTKSARMALRNRSVITKRRSVQWSTWTTQLASLRHRRESVNRLQLFMIATHFLGVKIHNGPSFTAAYIQCWSSFVSGHRPQLLKLWLHRATSFWGNRLLWNDCFFFGNTCGSFFHNAARTAAGSCRRSESAKQTAATNQERRMLFNARSSLQQ